MFGRRAALLAAGAVIAVAGIVELAREGPAGVFPPRDEPVPVARFGANREESGTVRLAGAVRAADDGKPIAGALACAHPAFDAPELCVASGPDGRFSFDVPSGFHKLEILAPGDSRYVDQWFEDRDRSRDAALLDLRKTGRDDVIVALAAGRRVSGRLLGRRDHAPVADGQACASPNDRPGAWTCVRTDAEGRYAMTILPGAYSLFFVPPDRTRLRPLWWADGDDVLGADAVDVSRGERTDVDATLPEGNVISGTIRSTGGRPLERVFVCVDTPFPTGRICRPTDKQGRYSVAVRRATYNVQFKPPVAGRAVGEWLGGAIYPREARSITVSGDVRLDATLQSGKLLWGQVTTERGGLPVEGATVNVYYADRACCAIAAATATGMGGDYAVVLRPGSYWVEAFPPFGSALISSFAGGPTAERARAVTVGDKEDRNFADIALDEVQIP